MTGKIRLKFYLVFIVRLGLISIVQINCDSKFSNNNNTNEIDKISINSGNSINSKAHHYSLDNSIYDEYDENDSGEISSKNYRNSHFDDHLLNGKSDDLSTIYTGLNTYNTNSDNQNKSDQLFESLINKCRSDQNCEPAGRAVCSKSIGKCVRLCDIRFRSRKECEYYHCDGKQLFVYNESLSNIENEFNLIETNNYPNLDRYLSRRKCSWILKNNFNANNNDNQYTSANFGDIIERISIPYVELSVQRFRTEFLNDYLYIFAGDSIYSPLIGTLSGSEISSNEPSRTVDLENEFVEQVEQNNNISNTNDSKSLNITLFNMKNVYFLFKPDVVSSLTALNMYFFKSSIYSSSSTASKPVGISIRPNLANCVEEKFINSSTKLLESFSTCFTRLKDVNQNKNQSDRTSTVFKLAQTVNYLDEEQFTSDLNSTIRRAMHCSFSYKNFMYIIGGYSFSAPTLSFVSRFNLQTLKWEHHLDRKASTVINRSNRKFFSNSNFKQLKLDLPQHRYAHSCSIDPKNEIVYMYGGIKYESEKYAQFSYKETTNELWSYNLQTNKWTLLNQGSQSKSGSNGNTISNSNNRAFKNYVLPIGVSGHSMQFIRNVQENSTILTIFFGYSEYYGQILSLIQEYNTESKTWDYRSVHGINIGYAHSSTFNPADNQIYFYGGLLTTSTSPNSFEPYKTLLFDSVSDSLFNNNRQSASSFFSSSSARFFSSSSSPHQNSYLYAYNLDMLEFRQVFKSTQSNIYMHSAQIYKNHLIVFGGVSTESGNLNWFQTTNSNTKNQNSFISNQLKVFSIDENKWIFGDSSSKMNKRESTVYDDNKQWEKNNSDEENEYLSLINRRQRFGHTSFLFNDSLLIFAGFNGFFLRDLFKFNLNHSLFKFNSRNNFQSKVGDIENDQQKLPTIYNRFLHRDRQSQQIILNNNNNNNNNNIFDSNPASSRTQSNETNQQYLEVIAYQDLICGKHTTCSMCQMDQNCIWNNRKCEYYNQYLTVTTSLSTSFTTKIYQKRSMCQNMCSEHRTCLNCTFLSNTNGQFYQNECVWCSSQQKCLLRKSINVIYPFGECLNLINERDQCEPSTTSYKEFNPTTILGFASSPPTPTFTDTNLTNQQDSNLNSTNLVNRGMCSQLYTNCSSCITDERCGWCSRDTDSVLNAYEINTGYGQCMEGGQSGALTSQMCFFNWFYSNCPQCECNGHSTCIRKATASGKSLDINLQSSDNILCRQCGNNTSGFSCGECRTGYYGDAKNNGLCSKCQCKQQANECDSTTGRCFCNAKGVIGQYCDQCDSPRYTGKPHLQDGTCYYNLTTDYQFTFNLNKEIDRYYSRISFVNHPIRYVDDDIDFMVRCFRENAMINISYALDYDYEQTSWTSINHMESGDGTGRPFSIDQPMLSNYNGIEVPINLLDNLTYFIFNTATKMNSNSNRKNSSSQTRSHFSYYNIPPNYYFGPTNSQHFLLTKLNCTDTEFKYTFSNKDLNYADRNLIFVVHVYNFQTPLSIQIAFSRKSRVHLLHFFVTFFGCLLTLLTIAFITWKTKQRYDRYRRQREVLHQMEQMASRPFTKLFVEVGNKLSFEEMCLLNNQREKKMMLGEANSGNHKKSSFKKSKKSPSPISTSIEVNNLKDNNSIQMPRIMPVAVEPLSNNKTAILTCLLKLPQGNSNGTPKGSSPFVLCSTYVNLNSNLLNYQTPISSNIVCDDEENKNDGNNNQANLKNVIIS